MQPLRVFLLLPEGDIHQSVTGALREPEFEHVWCRSASDALIVLGHSTFDLLISYAVLPEMSGLDFIASLDAEGIDLPSVMLLGPDDMRLLRHPSGRVRDIVPLSEDFAARLPDRAREAIAKHRLEQANRIYVAALESARDGIMITDLQGVVLHVNRALELLTGFSREELIGRPSQLVCSIEQNAELCARMWLAVKQRASWQGELIDRRKDGSNIDVSLTVSPILDKRGRLTHCVAIERESAPRRMIDSQLLQAQKVQSLGTLAGGVAHEFNNILTGIMGYAGLALSHGEEKQAHDEFLEAVLSLSQRAAVLTKQMLAYARRSPVNRRPLSVADLCRGTVELVERTLHQTVAVEGVDDGRSLHIDADVSQIEQVLLNLILNARDAMPEGGIVTIAARCENLTTSRAGFPENVPPGDYVHLEVRDRGHGMSPEIMSRAFDPFFTTRPVGKGTGMGLSVAMAIVRDHHGFLTIESKVDSGTIVGVFLPRLREEGEENTSEDPSIEPEPVRSARILVHDDEAAVLDMVRRYLEDAGHQVLSARDETEVLQLARGSGTIDMAILDNVPCSLETGGLIGQLLELRPNLPLLICPGQSLEEGAIQPGDRQRVLRKPFRMNELGFAVQELLSSSTK
jgi:two-component system cell cycle sensor histidine kinase/response regulator CckA